MIIITLRDSLNSSLNCYFVQEKNEGHFLQYHSHCLGHNRTFHNSEIKTSLALAWS